MARESQDIYDEDLRSVLGDKPKTMRRLFRRPRLGKWVLYLFGGLAVFVLAYWEIGGKLVETIDDDPGYTPAVAAPAGGSVAVHRAASLLRREIEQHGWTANDPFFLPGWALDNMPNYQQGIVYALSRFTLEMSDQIGRARGTSQVDPDLDRAVGLLRYPGDRWLFDLSASWAPVPSSESQYLAAAAALEAYNQRLAGGLAVFEVRADNLRQALDRIAGDLGSAAALADEHVALAGRLAFDARVDDIFYQAKGRLYGYLIVLQGLEQDFAETIETANLATVWGEMMASLRAAAEQKPLMVFNGGTSGLSFPNHLSNQSFDLLMARAKLREITDVLRN